MRTGLTLLVAVLLACGFSTYASAQDGVKFGMGIELQNQETMIHLDGFDFTWARGLPYLTPSILFTIQVTPSVFIEPTIGYHRTSYSEETTPPAPATASTGDWAGSDLMFGIGMIYALKPDATVSPMFHPMLGIHMVSATEEESSGGTTDKTEVSTTAFQVGLGIGGLVNVKETVYLTAEARLMITRIGDYDVTRPAPFVDNTTESATLFDTDMVIGLRFVF
jgi:hypothetical protein